MVGRKSKASHTSCSRHISLLHQHCCIRSTCFLYTVSFNNYWSSISHARSIQKAFTFYFTTLCTTQQTSASHTIQRDHHSSPNSPMHGKTSRHSCPSNKTHYGSALLFIRLCKSRDSGRPLGNRCNPFSRMRRWGAFIDRSQAWINLIYDDQWLFFFTLAQRCLHLIYFKRKISSVKNNTSDAKRSYVL